MEMVGDIVVGEDDVGVVVGSLMLLSVLIVGNAVGGGVGLGPFSPPCCFPLSASYSLCLRTNKRCRDLVFISLCLDSFEKMLVLLRCSAVDVVGDDCCC